MEEAIEQLLSRFKEPKWPYVLFAGGFIRYVKNLEDGTSKFERYLDDFCLDCSGCHAHPEKITQYMSKGWRVIKWKLPVDEKGVRIGKYDAFKGKTEFDPDVDHFEELHKYLTTVQQQSVMLSRDQVKELERTKKELADAKEKIAKANKKSAKPGEAENGEV